METINQDTVLNTAQNISCLRILGRPRLGKIFKIIHVQPSPTAAKSNTKSCPLVPHLHIPKIPPVMVTPPLLWAKLLKKLSNSQHIFQSKSSYDHRADPPG